MMELPQLKRIVEAALLASSQPLSLPQLFGLFGEQEQPTHDDLARALDELARDTEGRGVELKEVASGFRYQVRQDVNAWVSRLWTERQTRYSRAQLETLALIAYRQPITRGEIEQIRGVAVSSNIIKTLEEREWIRTVGHRDVPGKPELFGTTRTFLDYFNLKSLDELPPLAEIRDLTDFDPQLGLAPVPTGDATHGDSAMDRPVETDNVVMLHAAAAEIAFADSAVADDATAGSEAAEHEGAQPPTTETHGATDAFPPPLDSAELPSADAPLPASAESEVFPEHDHADEGEVSAASNDDAGPAPTEHTA